MDFLLPLLVSAPVWIVLLVGIVFGVLTLQEHRAVSLLAVVALSGFLLLDLVGTLVWTSYEWLVIYRSGSGISDIVTNTFFGVQTLVHTCFLGLAILASSRDRRPLKDGE